MLKVAVLNRVGREVLLSKWHINKKLKVARMQIMQLSGRRKGEVKGITSAKVLCGMDLARQEEQGGQCDWSRWERESNLQEMVWEVMGARPDHAGLMGHFKNISFFFLRDTRSHWRALSGRVQWSDLRLERINLATGVKNKFGQGGGSRSDEKWSVSRYSFKVELTIFANGLNVRCERKREVKGDSEQLTGGRCF